MTEAEISETLSMPPLDCPGSAQAKWDRKACRIGLGPAVRYERQRPGELVHIDVKKLGRFQAAGKRVSLRPAGQGSPRRRDAHGYDRGLTGCEYVHVALTTQPPRLR